VLLEAPIVRNAAKIRACIENAKRWCELAQQHGTYLGRIASIAATDDPVSGCPALSEAVGGDFVLIGDSAARQTRKRWGFFTAFGGRTTISVCHRN
jgi:3-methyladenine DNA glycosylase Tag